MNKSLIDDQEKLVDLVNKNLSPKKLEKHLFGEVFTPLNLIEDMLDQLPTKIWYDKNIKFFDPACGIGNFEICVYYRLLESLKNIIPNKKARKRHILENMIYVCELNKNNIKIYKRIFDRNKKYKLNIYSGDTLNLDIKNYFNIDHFDIIIGNPPYNKGSVRSPLIKKKKHDEKHETIWPKFIIKSLEILKPSGYLLFITPLSWLKLNYKLHDVLLNLNIIWLKLVDGVEAVRIINAGIPISFFVLKHEKNHDKNKTIVLSSIRCANVSVITKAYLDPKYSIPLGFFSIFNKVIKFIEDHDLKLLVNNKKVQSKGDRFLLPKKYELKDNLAVDTHMIKEGILVKKAIEKHPDADKNKIIIANKTGLIGSFIDHGKLSLTGDDKFYILGDNLKVLLNFFSYKICRMAVIFTKYRQCFLNPVAFEYIPDIRKYKKPNITEDDFYDLINLNKSEIKALKNL